MTEQQIAELTQLKAQYPIVSGNDYSRMNEQERVHYFHFLDLLEMETMSQQEDEGYPECGDEELVAAEW